MPGLDNQVVLLLHFDGADGATSFTDFSPSHHTITPAGTAQVDTAQSKFGGASLLLDGSGDYLTVPDHANWDYGTGDFTIDYWVRFNSVSNDQAMVASQIGNGGMGILIRFGSAGASGVSVFINSTEYTFTWTPSTNTWYHVALTRSGTNLRAFIDGTQVGTTQTNSTDITGSTAVFTVGARNGGGNALNGWLEELRVSKGIARWTTNFTPPTAPYNRPAMAVAFFEDYNPG